MSEMKHTPGPWVLIAATAEGGDESDTFFVKAQPHSALRGFTKDIAMVEGEPEARLIAAAPDLLEACMEAAFDIAADVHEGTRNKDDKSLALLRAAIAKAEGQS